MLYIMVGIMAFARYGRYTTFFGLVFFWWDVFFRTRYASLLRLPRTRNTLHFRTERYARIYIAHYTHSLPIHRPSIPIMFCHHITSSCPLPLRNPRYVPVVACLLSCASWPYQQTRDWPFYIYIPSYRYMLLFSLIFWQLWPSLMHEILFFLKSSRELFGIVILHNPAEFRFPTPKNQSAQVIPVRSK